MGSNHTEVLGFYPFLECYNIFCHIPYFFDCAATFDIKSIQNILCFCTNCFFVCDIISNSPHFFPVKLFGIQEHSVIQVGLINVQIHHTRIRSSDLSNVSITKSSSYLSCLAPVFDLSLNSRIAAFYNTCDNSMSLAGSFKVSNSFSNSTTCITFAQPCCDICVIIIQCFQFLNVYQNNRNIKITNCRKHIVRCSISQHLKEYKVNISCTEFVSCFH